MKIKQLFVGTFAVLAAGVAMGLMVASIFAIIHTNQIIDEDGNKVQLPLYDTNVGDFECQQGYLYQSFNRGAIVIFNKAGLPMRCKIVS